MITVCIKSYARSGTNFILENIKDYANVKKDHWSSEIDNSCLNVYVIRKPEDCISSNISMTFQDVELQDDQMPTIVKNEINNYINFLKTVYKNKNSALIINFEDLSYRPYDTLKKILDLSGLKENFIFKNIKVKDKKVFNYNSGKFQLFFATSQKNKNYKKIKELVIMEQTKELEDILSLVLTLTK